MKKILLFTAVLMFSINAFSQGINFFHGTFADAQAKAKKEGKEIFIDFYTQWCGPCKIMAKKYFTLESVGKVYNAKFVCLKVDAEKGEGIELAKKYGAKVYPTLVFIKADGTLVKKVEGMKKEEQLLELVNVK